MDHTFRRIAATLSLALFSICCSQPEKPVQDTRVADEAAIREADIAWSKIAESKQVDEHVKYYLTDATVASPNEELVQGRESIRKMVASMFAMPGFSIKWQPTKVEVSQSGDLGYSAGAYQMTMNGPNGAPMNDHGKYIEIWKKQADGSWKVATEMFNSDLPMTPHPAM
jgi:ketosteroid isomerase-like protein